MNRGTKAFQIFSMAAALLLAAAPDSFAAGRKTTVVVEAADLIKAPVLARLRAAFKDGSPLSIHEFHSGEMADPIRRGKLLAALQESELLVAIGASATELVLKELEDVSVYFVGGSLVGGSHMASPLVSGILSYNIDALLDAAKKIWSGKLGLAYTPGYEKIAATIRGGATARGFTVLEKKISTRREIPPAINELIDQSQAIWIVGDPLLAREAGFQFLIERSLSKQIPVVAAGAWEVEHGAFLSMEPPINALADEAAAAIKSIAQDGPALKSAIRTAPAGGTIIYNGHLLDKWRLGIPEGVPWRILR